MHVGVESAGVVERFYFLREIVHIAPIELPLAGGEEGVGEQRPLELLHHLQHPERTVSRAAVASNCYLDIAPPYRSTDETYMGLLPCSLK